MKVTSTLNSCKLLQKLHICNKQSVRRVHLYVRRVFCRVQNGTRRKIVAYCNSFLDFGPVADYRIGQEKLMVTYDTWLFGCAAPYKDWELIQNETQYASALWRSLRTAAKQRIYGYHKPIPVSRAGDRVSEIKSLHGAPSCGRSNRTIQLYYQQKPGVKYSTLPIFYNTVDLLTQIII
jgi:hypothetical protein